MQQFNSNAYKNPSSTVKAFLNNFVCEEFFADLINVCLYPAEFSSTIALQNNSVVEHFGGFLSDLIKTAKELNLQNYNQLYNYANLTYTILNIRESGSSIISYDNTQQHLPNIDLTQQQLIQRVSNNRLTSNNEFRQLTSRILNDIQTFYEVQSIKSGIQDFESFVDYASSNSVSVYEATKQYKDNVIKLYNDLANLHSLNKQENEKDYFCISDKDSTQDLTETLVEYLSTDYSFYSSGYDIIDNYIEGFESASFHLIQAPTNHGKSIFMGNIARKIIEENINTFEPDEAVLFITLEDDIKKLTRRLCSVFGNYDPASIKQLYSTAFDIAKANQMISSTNDVKKNLRKTVDNLLKNSLYAKTQNKVQLIVKHCNENEFSTGDLTKFIDLLRVEGINTKMVFLDYLDVMSPTVTSKVSAEAYEKQGQIVHELRTFSRNQKLPVVSASQNKRESENLQYGMNNQQVGDSYLKVRYSDFLYMCRMNTQLDPFSDAVSRHVFGKEDYTDDGNSYSPYILSMKDQISQNLIPFEVKITKSKDAGKDATKFLLFCNQNLRIYNTVDEYLQDIDEWNKHTSNLNNEIQNLSNMAISSVSDDLSDMFNEYEEQHDKVLPFS